MLDTDPFATHPSCRMRKRLPFLHNAAIIAVAIAFLLVTNRWLGWQGGIEWLSASDVSGSYEKMAAAAPAFPSEPIDYHHAQRFVTPYIVGLVSQLTGGAYSSWFLALTLCLQAVVLACVGRLTYKLGLSRSLSTACILLLALNPYAIRYSLIVPGMAQDVVFVAGMACALAGLVEARLALVLIGLGVSAIGRQTAVLLLPAVAWWIIHGAGWKGESRTFKTMALATTCSLTVGLYVLTSVLAARFGTESRNTEHLVAIFGWMASGTFSWGSLGLHFLRLFIPFWSVASLLFVIRTLSKDSLPIEFWFSAFMAACIALQPFLAGPDITGANGSRLAALGLVPATLALAYAMNMSRIHLVSGRLASVILLCWLMIGSLHHKYTIIGPSAISLFVVLQAIVALGLATSVWTGVVAVGETNS